VFRGACHVSQQLARSSFSEKANLSRFVLEFVVASLLGINADCFRLVTYRFDFIDAMSSSYGLASGVVTDECDGHKSELWNTAGPVASAVLGEPPDLR
jgi:hypothetical protein